jgi:hypothetical protein
MTLQCLGDLSLKSFNTFSGWNLLPELANILLMRLDETQKAV